MQPVVYRERVVEHEALLVVGDTVVVVVLTGEEAGPSRAAQRGVDVVVLELHPRAVGTAAQVGHPRDRRETGQAGEGPGGGLADRIEQIGEGAHRLVVREDLHDVALGMGHCAAVDDIVGCARRSHPLRVSQDRRRKHAHQDDGDRRQGPHRPLASTPGHRHVPLTQPKPMLSPYGRSSAAAADGQGGTIQLVP